MASVGVGAAALGGLLVWRMQPPSGPMPALPGDMPGDGDESVALKSSGHTRYRLKDGPGPLVVLVHGISYPMEVYDVLFRQLAGAGRSVLMYDLSGRGYSHTNGEPLTIECYVRQLQELLDALGLSERELEIVGWSMGSVIATHYACARPSSVTKLVLLAPVGGAPAAKPRTAGLLHAPFGVGNALGELFVRPSLNKLYQEELGQMSDGGKLLRFLCDHATRNSALPRSMVSTLRSCPELDNNHVALAQVGAHDRPVLVLWGTADATTTRSSLDALLALLPRAKLVCLDDLRHSFIVTSPDQANPPILSFLGV